MPGCDACGEHRAPKDRSLSNYYYFCTEHAREYNKTWNFFEGMSTDDVEEHVSDHMKYEIDGSVSEHLGKFSKDLSRQMMTAKHAHPVVKLFYDRQTVAQAIMLNEILSPPLSKRK